uniref:Uncharacterized protein n=1 Tax=Anopheles albimanus TaxID=7167 RepID=A0A182F8B4_ANOAL
MFWIFSCSSMIDNETACADDKFRCKNGRCILKRWQCDGEKDCADGSDEDTEKCLEGKTCSGNEVLCSSHDRCIPKTWVCDREADCPGGTDEQNCENKVCTSEEFTCRSGTGNCIPLSWMCDQNRDCADGSDESSCSEYSKWKLLFHTSFLLFH